MVPTNHGAQTQDAWNQTMQGANMDLFRQTQINVGGGDAGDKLLIVGGVIPVEDQPVLRDAGVARIFTMGTATREIVDYLQAWHAGREQTPAA